MNQQKEREEDFVQLCKALGHETRFAIIRLLLERKKFCGDLVQELNLPQSTVSHHLKILKNSGLVVAEEQGTWVCYEVDLKRMGEMKRFLEQLIV
ncbi:ArsR/SmtB family transcription factor [Thermicanus aegyptius]|uniref:ArsR/SmtB family transcription factor n=1 Tax=Thermicanus aegyptius TaxID=94009 RepID=UPI000427B4FE|nr:metalloregulator ArsR/SmtB family transcription factor [Thermicanus aegyptius]